MVSVDLTRDELELIRTALKRQGAWYLNGGFMGLSYSVLDLTDKISNIIIENSAKVSQ